MRKICLLAIASVMMLSACQSNKESIPEPLMEQEVGLNDKLYKEERQQEDTLKKDLSEPARQQPARYTSEDWNRKIIKTADMSGEVNRLSEYDSMLRRIVRQYDGYIAQESRKQTPYRLECSLVIKVPAADFESALQDMAAHLKVVEDRKVTSSDVSTEIVDVQSRMEAKKQVRKRYLDLMTQAKTMEEILNVQSAVNSIQEEIEVAAGRSNYLQSASRMSTIQLRYFEQLLGEQPEQKDDQNLFKHKIAQAFYTGWRLLADICILLAYLWPVWLLLGTGIFIYQRKKAKQRTG